MHLLFSFPSSLSSVSRRCFQSSAVVSILTCLSVVMFPCRMIVARTVVGSAHTSPGITAAPSSSRLNSSTVGSPFNSDIANRNTEAQLARLALPSSPGFDIVPPAHPGPTSGPLPGYQIVALGRGHYNRLCLAGTVAGIKGLMMVDTGASTTALSDATYHSLSLDASYKLPGGLPSQIRFNGTDIPLAEAPNFYVGKSNLGAVPVSLIPSSYLFDANPQGGQGRHYDGLLGENILRHYNALIDCGRLVLYLDIDSAKKINLSSAFVRQGWTRVPMTYTGSHYTVPCVLNGHSYRLVVDTGSPFTNLDRHLLTAAGITSHDLPVRGGLIGTQREQVGMVDLDHLQIGGYTVNGVHMTTTAQSLAAFGGSRGYSTDVPVIGLLGGDTLASNHAVIDIGSQTLFLKHAGTEHPKHS